MAYRPLAKRDSLVILQGLLILTAIIFTGVTVAQYQLANLTQKKEQTPFFSLARNDNYHYSVYFLGSGGHFGQLYHLGEFSLEDGWLICRSDSYQFNVPIHLRFEMDMVQAKLRFKAASVHFYHWALAVKRYVTERALIIIQYLPVLK